MGKRGGGGPGGGRRSPAGKASGVFGKAVGERAFRVGKGRGGGKGSPPAGGKRGGPSAGGGQPGSRRGGSPESQGRPTSQTKAGGDPVAIVTGEALLTQTDVSWPGVLPFELSRTHISSYRGGRLFGPSWGSTLDQALEVDGAGVHFLAEDASVRTYPQALLPNVAFLPIAGPQHPLVLTSEGGYTLTDPETGRVLHFPAPGQETGWSRLPLTAVTDRNGNRVDLVYEDQVLVEVRHSGGFRVIVDTAPSVGGEGERRVTALRTPDGTVLKRFGYDPHSADLTEVLDSSGVPQRFTYDDAHRLTGWVDRNDFWYRYTYDAEGRAVRGEGSQGCLDAAFRYDPDGRQTIVTDALGHATTYRYNERDQIVEEIDPLGAVTRSEWDAFDRLLSHTDPLGETTRYGYDERGNLTSIIRPDGTRTAAEYNDLNLPVHVTYPDGSQWRQEYDERGNLVRQTDPSGAVTTLTYAGTGAPTGVVNALGHTIRIEPDTAGQPLTVTDANGGVARHTYDAMGRLTGYTDPAGQSMSLTWTVEGHLASRTMPDGTAESWRYDGEGNEVEHTDERGQVTRTEYGPLDVMSATVRPDGSRLDFAHDGERRLTRVTAGALTWDYTYDQAGYLTAETDFNGRTLTYGHDEAGRLVSRTNGAGQTTTFTRDRFGDTVEKDAAGRVTTFRYDSMGRLTDAANADATLHFDYDAMGRMVAQTSNGAPLAVTYDAVGQVVSRRTPSGVESTWTYGPTGLPTSLRTGGQVLTFAHDRVGREVERRIGAGAMLAQQWDAGDRLTAQTVWGAPGRPGEQARLLQHRAYAYRPDGNLTGVDDRLAGRRSFDLDARGRITAVRARAWTERYAYDDAGNLAHAEWPGPAQESGETGGREHAGTMVRSAGRTRFEHDAQGRVVLREQTTLSGRRRRWRFHWDAEDRLIGAETPDGSRWRYHYDPLGRRTAKQQLAPDGGAPVQSYLYTWDGTRLAEQAHNTRDGGGRPIVRTTRWDYEPESFNPVTQSRHTFAADAPQEWIDRQFHAIVTDLVGTPAELVTPEGALTPAVSTNPWNAPAGEPQAFCPLGLPGQYRDYETGLSYNFQRYYDPATATYATPDPLGLAPQPNAHAYVPNPTAAIDPLGLSPHAYRTSGDPKVAGRQLADDIGKNDKYTKKTRPGVAEALRLQNGDMYKRSSVRGSMPPLHRDVQNILDNVPAGQRGNGHGQCGLPRAISAALNDGQSPQGATAAAFTSRKNTDHAGHGVPIGPCDSCKHLVSHYGIQFLT